MSIIVESGIMFEKKYFLYVAIIHVTEDMLLKKKDVFVFHMTVQAASHNGGNLTCDFAAIIWTRRDPLKRKDSIVR